MSAMINFINAMINLRRQKSVVGLDVGSHSVKLVHLNHENGTYGLLAGLVEEYPSSQGNEEQDAAILKAIKEIFQKAGLKPGSEAVVTAVSGAGTAIKQVEFPMLTDEELKSSLQWQAGKRLPFGPEEAVLDHQVIFRDEEVEKMSVLLTAVTRVHLAEHLDLLEKVGIDPPIIDLGPLALANTLLATQDVDDKSALVVLDLGNSRTILNVFSPSGLFFTRDIDISGRKLTQEIQNQLGISYDEAERIKREGKERRLLEILRKPLDHLIFEIRRALTYYENRRGMGGFQKVYLAGGGAHLVGLSKYLHDELGVKTKELDAFKNVKILEGKRPDKDLAPRLSLAFGLATRKIRKSHV
jgi:type IV pilus assembly protein PilM